MKREDMGLLLRKWGLMLPLVAVPAVFPAFAADWSSAQTTYYQERLVQAAGEAELAKRALLEVRLQRLILKAREQQARIEQWHKRVEMKQKKARLATRKQGLKKPPSRQMLSSK